MLRQHALPLGVVPISLGFDARDAESRGFGDDELVVGSDPWSALVKLWRLRNTISVESASASASASDCNDIAKTVASSASGGPRHVAIRVKLSASSTATWIVPVQVDTSLASTNGIVSKQLWNRLSALTSGVDDDELADFGSSVTLDVELEVAQPVPLQEAVFDVDDSAAYARLCDDSSAFISSKIVRMGESIDVTVMRGEHGEESQSITAHSTSTSPVRQGIITPATRIIIRKSEQLERTQQNEGVATTFDNSADLILAADFLAQQALSFSIDSDLDDIAMDEDEANDSVAESGDSHLWQKRSHSMSAHVRPDHIESGLLLPRPGVDVDESRIVIVTLDTLARLQAASGDWVYISNENSNSNSNSSSNSSNPGSLYRAYAICPGLLPTSSSSNSSSNGSLLNGSVWMTTAQMMSIGVNPTDGVSIRTIASSENIPSAARVLTLARVATPPSSTMSSASGSGRLPEEACLSALKNWLATKPRQLSVGDVISLQVDQSAESAKAKLVRPGDKWEDIAVPSASSSSSLSAPSPVQSRGTVETIYYKATALEPFLTSATGSVSDSAFAHHGFYSVDPAQTAVTQSGTIRTRFPRQPQSSQTSSDPAINRLTKLFESSLHPLARTQELTCSILLHGASGSGKHTSVLTAAKTCGLHVYRVHVPRFVRESDDKTIAALETYFETAAQYAPCVFVLTGIEMLTRDGRGSAAGGGGGGDPNAPMSPVVRALEKCVSTLSKQASFAERDNWPVAVVGITSSALDRLPSGLSSCFKFNIGIQVPAEPARQAMLTSLLSKVTVAPDVSIKQLATQTASFVTSDLNNVVSKASLAAWERAVSACTHSTLLIRDVALAGSVVCMADITSALAAARSMLSDTLGVPKIPNVTWDDVGGLASVKRDILDMVQLPMERPDLFANGVKKRSGVLLYGPPGTGKTLLAKAVATSCSLNFFSVKGPELLNMYIGESEANVRRVFQRARDARPCVVFFDELDSLAPRRGQQGDSGGVMDRIVSQLLAELDGMSSAPSNDDEDGKDGSSGGGAGGDVFVIGATNRPDLLDPALLRPGRFDKMLYLGVSDDHDSQLKIIQALTRKFNLDPELDLAEIAEMCPFNYTGADMYALCSDAMLKAMISRVNAVDAKIAEINSQGIHEPGHPVPMTPQYFLDHLATPADIQVVVTKDDFVAALDELVPSVSMEELDRYQEIRRKFTPEGQVADKPKEQQQQQQQQQAVQKKQQPRQYQKVAVLSTDDRRVSVSPEIAPTFVDDDDEEEEDIDGEFYNDPAEKAKGKRPMLPSNDL
ncbi:AAA-domain-containing protein, partial [Ramicandelaber brevisporus]